MARPYNRKDHYYQSAKEAGYRSRAAYKLIELDKRFKLFAPGAVVFDLGCWPGGWSQVAAEKVGPKGSVVGIDLEETERLPQSNVHFFKGDLTASEVWAEVAAVCAQPAQVVMSDMSAKLCGIPEIDQQANLELWRMALSCLSDQLAPKGACIIKVFKGREVEGFVKEARPLFHSLDRCELDASRNTSKEFYLVGRGFKRIAKAVVPTRQSRNE